jgi:hypothetical protein
MATITLKHSRCSWKGKLRMWLELTHLAEKYGWKPAGTKAPAGYNGDIWDGDYRLPVNQTVSADDGRALAATLRSALISTSTFISGDARREIIAFAKFCERGEFAIVPTGARLKDSAKKSR